MLILTFYTLNQQAKVNVNKNRNLSYVTFNNVSYNDFSLQHLFFVVIALLLHCIYAEKQPFARNQIYPMSWSILFFVWSFICFNSFTFNSAWWLNCALLHIFYAREWTRLVCVCVCVCLFLVPRSWCPLSKVRQVIVK